MVDKEKNWFRRHWVLSIILVIVVIGVIGILTEDTDNSVNDIQDEETEKVHNIGDNIKIKDIEYSVNEIFTLPIVASDSLYEEADGIFMIISLTIKNNGKDEVFLSGNSFKIKDSQGRIYKTDITAGVYLSTMGFDPFVFKTLGAGLQTSGEIVFDVPEDDTGLILEITGEGLFSDTIKVEIGDVADY